MIEFLKIDSIAIFDEIAIEFASGLNCITGETGAGKSLIIGALTLLMGAKTGPDLIRPGREKAVVEALFSNAGQEVVLKREIFASGRTRCYINGELATTEKMGELTTGLIHIYGQHQYQDLLNPREHMRILEDLDGLGRQVIMEAYQTLESTRRNLASLEDAITQARREQEDIGFSLQELMDAHIEADEELRLAQALETARAAETLKQSAVDAFALLYSEPQSAMDQLSSVKGLLKRMSAHDPRIDTVLVSLESAMALIEDTSLTVRDFKDAYEYDSDAISKLEERLHLIQDLKHKHHTDEAGLMRIKNDLSERLTVLEDAGHLIKAAQDSVAQAHAAYLLAAAKFLKDRAAFAQTFAERINADLKGLGMSGTRFSVSQIDPSSIEDLSLNGDDISPARLLQGEFMIRTNVGQKMLPLTKIASGGELSRIMLAIKVQQRKMQDATLIFDEIDAGISGQTAIMIASRLKSLAEHAQSIVITHLHQVAALADNHLRVSKSVSGSDTIAAIQPVAGHERVMELARMMGGENPGPKVIAHARELMKG